MPNYGDDPQTKRRKAKHIAHGDQSGHDTVDGFYMTDTLVKEHPPTLKDTLSDFPSEDSTASYKDSNEDPQYTALCPSCRNLRISPTRDVYREYRSVRIAENISIEAKKCSLCIFFRGLRNMRASVGADPSEDGGKLYNIIDHSVASLISVDGRLESSFIFSLEPVDQWEAVIPGYPYMHPPSNFGNPFRSHGTYFSSPSWSPIRQPARMIDYPVISGWLDFCKTHHTESCSAGSLTNLPSFQVIDCYSRNIVIWPTDIKPPYLALSYLWGKGRQDRPLTPGTLPTFTPPVIEDAIQVTIGLGYQYLWVDRYCIPQSDAAAKRIQISNMNYIYRHSELTIIAAAGNDPMYGLPGVSKRPRTKYPSVSVSGTTFLPLLSSAAHDLKVSAWNTRSWTYQEGLLSIRCLIFTDSQVHFQCRVMDCSEGFSMPLEAIHTYNEQRLRNPGRPFRIDFICRGAEQSFFQAATDYARRNLTRENDALNAFKGVLEEYRNPRGGARPMPNFFGIPLYWSDRGPTEVLVYGLNWSIYDERTFFSKTPPASVQRRRSFPSWTWLEWKISGPLNLATMDHGVSPYDLSRGIRVLPSHSPFISCVRIHIKRRSSTQVMEWQECKDLILELYSSGHISPQLGITGWIFGLRAPINNLQNGLPYHYQCGPFTVNQEALDTAYSICKELQYGFLEGDNGMVEFEMLLLSFRHLRLSDGFYKIFVTSMIIARPCPEEPYERVALLELHCFWRLGEPSPRIWDQQSQCPGADFPPCSKKIIWLE